jgi:hypothetical protein
MTVHSVSPHRDAIVLQAHLAPGNVGDISSHNTIINYGSKLREFEDVNSWSFWFLHSDVDF